MALVNNLPLIRHNQPKKQLPPYIYCDHQTHRRVHQAALVTGYPAKYILDQLVATYLDSWVAEQRRQAVKAAEGRIGQAPDRKP